MSGSGLWSFWGRFAIFGFLTNGVGRIEVYQLFVQDHDACLGGGPGDAVTLHVYRLRVFERGFSVGTEFEGRLRSLGFVTRFILEEQFLLIICTWLFNFSLNLTCEIFAQILFKLLLFLGIDWMRCFIIWSRRKIIWLSLVSYLDCICIFFSLGVWFFPSHHFRLQFLCF